ncbi:MAG: M48 family metallopeptidase [Chloroflexi bacterium]|nr:M48 family metallopeptidase [Chloroflexota bacterium]
MPVNQFTFGSTTFDFTLLHSSKLKTVKIVVEFEHGVEVTAPTGMSDQAVEQILQQKGRWIMEKLDAIASIEAPAPRKEFVSGEKFLYLGRQHTLIVLERAERRPMLIMRNSTFEATVSPELKIWDRQHIIRELFRAWYKQRAEAKLIDQVRAYANRLNLQPTDVRVMEMDRRWGSCTPRGAVHLNWRLIMAPIQIIDYLVVHELCHLSIPAHSPQFWDRVGSILADYETSREWLRVNGPTLTV